MPTVLACWSPPHVKQGLPVKSAPAPTRAEIDLEVEDVAPAHLNGDVRLIHSHDSCLILVAFLPSRVLDGSFCGWDMAPEYSPPHHPCRRRGHHHLPLLLLLLMPLQSPVAIVRQNAHFKATTKRHSDESRATVATDY
uniref:Uncharacterized protein n=1 Tax=Mesocestoides corti TaxID=53468 RepID=A0A5K3FF75_MESCO